MRNKQNKGHGPVRHVQRTPRSSRDLSGYRSGIQFSSPGFRVSLMVLPGMTGVPSSCSAQAKSRGEW